MYLLDTNACIYYIKHADSGVRKRIASLSPTEIAIPSIVKFEMYYGSMRSRDPISSLQIQDEFFNQFESLSFDDRAAMLAGRIRADLAAKGTPIGPYDLQIAAIALANNLILITNNISEFSRITNLQIEDWQTLFG